jgi:cAMP phosphodiesterase
VYALQATIDALKIHIFSNIMQPDLSRIPTAPFVTFITLGDEANRAARREPG